jgi:hypothetical protein
MLQFPIASLVMDSPRRIPTGAPPPPIRELLSSDSGSIWAVTLAEQNDVEFRKSVDLIRTTLLAQTAPFAVIMDLRQMSQFPPTQREMYASVREQLRLVYAKYHRLSVYVANTTLQRGFVTAVGWKAQAAEHSGRIFTEDFEQARAHCWQALIAAR